MSASAPFKNIPRAIKILNSGLQTHVKLLIFPHQSIKFSPYAIGFKQPNSHEDNGFRLLISDSLNDATARESIQQKIANACEVWDKDVSIFSESTELVQATLPKRFPSILNSESTSNCEHTSNSNQSTEPNPQTNHAQPQGQEEEQDQEYPHPAHALTLSIENFTFPPTFLPNMTVNPELEPHFQRVMAKWVEVALEFEALKDSVNNREMEKARKEEKKTGDGGDAFLCAAMYSDLGAEVNNRNTLTGEEGGEDGKANLGETVEREEEKRLGNGSGDVRDDMWGDGDGKGGDGGSDGGGDFGGGGGDFDGFES